MVLKQGLRPTLYELQAVDKLNLFGCIKVKMSERGISSKTETLQMFYGLNQPVGGTERQTT